MKTWLNNPDEKTIDLIFKMADRDQNSSIDVDEFVYAFMSEHFFK